MSPERLYQTAMVLVVVTMWTLLTSGRVQGGAARFAQVAPAAASVSPARMAAIYEEVKTPTGTASSSSHRRERKWIVLPYSATRATGTWCTSSWNLRRWRDTRRSWPRGRPASLESARHDLAARSGQSPGTTRMPAAALALRSAMGRQCRTSEIRRSLLAVVSRRQGVRIRGRATADRPGLHERPIEADGLVQSRDAHSDHL